MQLLDMCGKWIMWTLSACVAVGHIMSALAGKWAAGTHKVINILKMVWHDKLKCGGKKCIKNEKKTVAATQLCKSLTGCTRCSDCVWALANSTRSPNITKKKEENKTTGTSPVATCLEYISHCGAGSTLTAHYHPSVPVVAATVADGLYSSPLAGYRSTDSLSCGRGRGVWGDEAGQKMGASTQQ